MDKYEDLPLHEGMRYYFCRRDPGTGAWVPVIRFEGPEGMLAFIARHWKSWRFSPGPYCKGRVYNDLYEDLNFSGSDTRRENKGFLFHAGEIVPRSTCFMDSAGRIINPRLFDRKTIRMADAAAGKGIRYTACDTYRFRNGPVPGVHKIRGGYYRTWKSTQRGRVQDNIPEYAAYVRKGAVPADYWDVEPRRHFEQSWKHQSKCRHQWERHMRRHVDTGSMPGEGT